MGGWMDGHEQVGGWMDMDGWVDGWMDILLPYDREAGGVDRIIYS